MPAGSGRRLGRVLPMTNETAGARKDWVRQPLSFVLWWGLPLVIGALVGVLHLPFRTSSGVLSPVSLDGDRMPPQREAMPPRTLLYFRSGAASGQSRRCAGCVRRA